MPMPFHCHECDCQTMNKDGICDCCTEKKKKMVTYNKIGELPPLPSSLKKAQEQQLKEHLEGNEPEESN